MSKAIRVLVVEDSDDDTLLAMQALRRGGFAPTWRRVQDAATLREALVAERWDAVVSDFRLPGFTGVQALGIFREAGLDLPFIFVSGTIGEETAVEAIKAGASDYVMKGNLARLAPVMERELWQAAIRAENRQAQQAVMQNERLRALGQMASGIAHDINNALSPVALYTQALLEHESGLSPRARDYLQQIDRAIADVAATVCRLREFYRPRQPQLEMRDVKVNLLVQHVLDLTRARWSDMPQQRGAFIDLRTELAPDLPRVLGIDGEIRDALVNLVFNAVDAMPEGGNLNVRTRAVGGPQPQVCIDITDSGVGMDTETLRRCPEPFFTTKGERGTGLGLAMVFGAMQRHGGDLRIDSVIGRGTTVSLCFPIAGADGLEAPAEMPALAGAPRAMRVLVIDDDAALLQSLRQVLETEGHDVTAAAGGQAGIDAFGAALRRGEPYAAVITDLGMPRTSGREVAAQVKAASPSTPVILLTGWGQQPADGGVPDHVDVVLGKPPRLSELREALARMGER